MNKEIHIKFSVNAWCKALGKDPMTLKRRLIKAGVNIEGEITAKDMFIALGADEDADARRKLKAEADLLEQEAKREAGNLFYWEEVQKVVTDTVVLPISQFVSSIPTTYAVRCNPLDSELAQNALDQLVEDMKKILRLKLPKPEIDK